MAQCPFLVAASMGDEMRDAIECIGADCKLYDAVASNCGMSGTAKMTLLIAQETLQATALGTQATQTALQTIAQQVQAVETVKQSTAQGTLAIQSALQTTAQQVLAVQLPLLVAATHALAPATSKLASATVDVNAVATTALLTVPAGKKCVVTDIMIHSANRSLDQVADAVSNIGFDAAVDLVVSGDLSKVLDATTKAAKLTLAEPKVMGTAGQVLNWHNTGGCTTADSTLTCDVFGYLV